MTMHLDKLTVEDLLLAAIKSEMESKEVYDSLADRVKNAFLKDKLRFLAKEEANHRAFLESIFKRTFKGKELKLPEASPVPLPLIIYDDEATTPVSTVLESAMGAEKAANEFYNDLAERFSEELDIRNKLKYLASMEMGHYRLLELAVENIRLYEDYLDEWPMMHAGP